MSRLGAACLALLSSASCIDAGVEIPLPTERFELAFLAIHDEEKGTTVPVGAPFRLDAGVADPPLPRSVSIPEAKSLLLIGLSSDRLDEMPYSADRSALFESELVTGYQGTCERFEQRSGRVSWPLPPPSLFTLSADDSSFVQSDRLDLVDGFRVSSPALLDPCPADRLGHLEPFGATSELLSEELVGTLDGEIFDLDFERELKSVIRLADDRVLAATKSALFLFERKQPWQNDSAHYLRPQMFENGELSEIAGVVLLENTQSQARILFATRRPSDRPSENPTGGIFEQAIDQRGFVGSPVERYAVTDRRVLHIAADQGQIVAAGEEGLVLTSTSGGRSFRQTVLATPRELVKVRFLEGFEDRLAILDEAETVWLGDLSADGVLEVTPEMIDPASGTISLGALLHVTDLIVVHRDTRPTLWALTLQDSVPLERTESGAWKQLPPIAVSSVAEPCAAVDPDCGGFLLSSGTSAASSIQSDQGELALFVPAQCSAVLGMSVRSGCPFTLPLPPPQDTPAARDRQPGKTLNLGPLQTFDVADGRVLFGGELGGLYELVPPE